MPKLLDIEKQLEEHSKERIVMLRAQLEKRVKAELYRICGMNTGVPLSEEIRALIAVLAEDQNEAGIPTPFSGVHADDLAEAEAPCQCDCEASAVLERRESDDGE